MDHARAPTIGLRAGDVGLFCTGSLWATGNCAHSYADCRSRSDSHTHAYFSIHPHVDARTYPNSNYDACPNTHCYAHARLNARPNYGYCSNAYGDANPGGYKDPYSGGNTALSYTDGKASWSPIRPNTEIPSLRRRLHIHGLADEY